MTETESATAPKQGIFGKSFKRLWFYGNAFFTVLYLLWRIFFTIPYESGILSIIAGVSLFIIEALGMVEAVIHYTNMYSLSGYPLPKVRDEDFPHVDIFVATYNEDPDLVYKTINGCKHMKYPDKSKVHIYVCDDGHRQVMKEKAAVWGVNYLDRPNHAGQKAGNLNNALAHSTSPLVVTFDADMIPQSCFLLRTIPYFVDAEYQNHSRAPEDQVKLGFLQTPQAFYNTDLFQWGLFSEARIPNEQDYFYRDIQVARTKSNSVIYGGSNTILLREALEAVGGFYTKAITEDFATGILIEEAGYVTLGTPEPLASGLSPTDLKSLIQQRIRWGRGVIATGRQMKLFRKETLSFAQKMNYWASIWYWYAPIKRLVYIMSPLLYAAFDIQVLKCTLPQILLFWLPMFLTSSVSLRMLSGNIRSSKWTGIYETAMFPFLLVPIILETFGVSLKKFEVTDKSGQTRRERNILYSIPFLLLILLSVFGIFRCVTIIFDSMSLGPIVVLFWLVFNLYLLMMSLFFVSGRIQLRKSERVATELDALAEEDTISISCTTMDISEHGLRLKLSQPHYLQSPMVTVSNGTYTARIRCTVVYTRQIRDAWYYSLKIIDYLESYTDWLQLIYDRPPALPGHIKLDSGVYDDLRLNIAKRADSPKLEKRALPRIPMNCSLPIGEDRTITIREFSFRYVLAQELVGLHEEVCIPDGPILILSRRDIPNPQKPLYRVENWRDLVSDPDSYGAMMAWILHAAETPRTTIEPQENAKTLTFNEACILDEAIPK